MKSIFPAPENGDENGIVAVSTDLDCGMLLDAYCHGIFPWPCEEETVLWCSPKMRGVMEPDSFHIPKRFRRDMKKLKFTFRMDSAFDAVIDCCAASPRPGQDGTWITAKLRKAYKEFHRLGFAHSFEAFDDAGGLAGGMYGVRLGPLFCGESMFFRRSGASKFALVNAVSWLTIHGVRLIDTQMVTPTTALFGAREIPKEEYLARLEKLRPEEYILSSWKVRCP